MSSPPQRKNAILSSMPRLASMSRSSALPSHSRKTKAGITNGSPTHMMKPRIATPTTEETTRVVRDSSWASDLLLCDGSSMMD